KITENVLTPCAEWYEGVPQAMLFGGVSGGATAGILYGIWQLLAPGIRTGSTTVYRYLENGKTRYIGITDDFARRAGEHLSSRGWAIQPIKGLQNLSRADARAVEQALIEHYGLSNLLNKINSISPRNPMYGTMLQRGNQILRLIRFR
ncbi:MAG: GIY-YIG nuclease family protein, partial [Anaerolineae bacterium]|nr:GIY-YIG nuclease family protein [Anaerolineae bacterium]